MIFYFDEEVNWQKPKTDIDRQVRKEIEQIEADYFSPKTLGVVKLVYPKGKPEKVHKVFGVLKKFPIPLKSVDGVWRYSATRPRITKNGKEYSDHHKYITYSTVYHKKDIEFVWFLKHKSAAVASGRVYIQNLEEEARKEVDEMSTDADIKFMLMGKHSPISKNEVMIREVAEIFGIKDVEKRGIYQIKIDLYDALVEGERMGDMFTNFKKFEEVTEGNEKRKAAFHARRSINDNLVGYKNRAWYIKHGKDFAEKLMDVRPQEVEMREDVFINEVINNPNVKHRLFNAIGEDEGTTLEDLRMLDRHVLMQNAGDYGIKVSNTTKKEEVIEKLCEKMNLEYIPKPA